MTRPWHICILFVLCLTVVLAAMGWTSLTVIRLDRAEEQARRQSELEESVRLALWRMDSALAPLIAQESARPYFAYGAFYPAERAYTQMFNDIQNGEPLSPSPLLNEPVPHALIHFQFGPDGQLSSPQVPTGNKVDLAKQLCKTSDAVQANASRLSEFQSQVAAKDLLNALHEDPVVPVRQEAQQKLQQESQGDYATDNAYKQSNRSKAELQKRSEASQQIAVQGMNWGYNAAPKNLISKNTRLTEGLIKPVWIGKVLVLARRVVVNGHVYVQGCWLDWAEISQWLLSNISDLLPAANLQPLKSDADDRGAYRLASLPVQLVPGALDTAIDPEPFFSPLRLSLFVAWLCVLLAAAAVGALLLGAVSLSERRGAFVSAVTHELRTPLTTFRMYTEMLAGGMVPQEEKRQLYLNTLRAEAERLSHLVENVLTYARLERTSRSKRMEQVDLCQVLTHLKERLAERAHQADMELGADFGDGAPVFAQADPAAVEQILFNLVDNACKYGMSLAAADLPGGPVASSHNGRRGVIELSVKSAKGHAEIRARDYGQGISKVEARKLFRPFSKSARDAASTAPGVGLGLALSRRLAREMRGDLYLDHGVKDGACFILSLPVN